MWRGSEILGEGCSERDICGEEGCEGYMCGEGDICGERQKEVERGKEVYGVGGREVDIEWEGEM